MFLGIVSVFGTLYIHGDSCNLLFSFCAKLISSSLVNRSVQSAGNFDLDMEMRCWFKGFWENKVKQDLRSGRADIIGKFHLKSNISLGTSNSDLSLCAMPKSDSTIYCTFRHRECQRRYGFSVRTVCVIDASWINEYISFVCR